jgi:hypothetical protein
VAGLLLTTEVMAGFSLHAGVQIAPHQREKLGHRRGRT